MVSLVDIVPQTRTVFLEAGEVELRGLGLRHLADLLLHFPELRKIWMRGSAPALDVETLLAAAPGAIGSIIATAAGQPEAAGNIAAAMPLDDIMECLIAIRDLTMPGGADPFVEKVARLVGAEDALSGKEADMSMPPLPSN